MWRALLLLALVACEDDTGVSAELGATCAVTSDECAELCLRGDEFPGGFCTLDCATDDDCPATAGCVAQGEGLGVCLFLCRDDRDCRFLDPTGGEAWGCRERPARAETRMELVCIGD